MTPDRLLRPAAQAGTSARSAEAARSAIAAWHGLPAVLLLLVTIGLIRALLVLGSGAGLYLDEAQYWEWSRELQWGYYSKPPMIAALIAASTALFGDDVLGVRALAMFCWLASALALYGLAGHMVLDSLGPQAEGQARRAGFWAALLFVSTPLSGILGLSATTDAPLLLCWTLATWTLWTALRSGRWWHWAGLGLILGLGLLSKYTIAAFVPAAALLVLHQALRPALCPHEPGAAAEATGARPRTRLLQSLLALPVAALVCLPSLAWNAAWGWPTWRHTADITARAVREAGVDRWASLAEYLGGQWLLVGPIVGGWLLVALLRWLPTLLAALRRPEDGRAAAPRSSAAAMPWSALADARRHVLWLSLPLLAIGVAQALHATAQINWTAPAVPGLLLWLALRISANAALPAGTPTRPARLAAWAVGVNFVLILLVTGAPWMARQARLDLPGRWDVWARMRGWTEPLVALAPLVVARPGVPVVALNRDMITQGSYAWRHQHVTWLAWQQPGTLPQNHYELTRPLTSAHVGSRLLILSNDPLPQTLRESLAELRPIGSANRVINGRAPQEFVLWEARLATWPAAGTADAAETAGNGPDAHSSRKSQQ